LPQEAHAETPAKVVVSPKLKAVIEKTQQTQPVAEKPITIQPRTRPASGAPKVAVVNERVPPKIYVAPPNRMVQKTAPFNAQTRSRVRPAALEQKVVPESAKLTVAGDTAQAAPALSHEHPKALIRTVLPKSEFAVKPAVHAAAEKVPAVVKQAAPSAREPAAFKEPLNVRPLPIKPPPKVPTKAIFEAKVPVASHNEQIESDDHPKATKPKAEEVAKSQPEVRHEAVHEKPALLVRSGVSSPVTKPRRLIGRPTLADRHPASASKPAAETTEIQPKTKAEIAKVNAPERPPPAAVKPVANEGRSYPTKPVHAVGKAVFAVPEKKLTVHENRALAIEKQLAAVPEKKFLLHSRRINLARKVLLPGVGKRVLVHENRDEKLSVPAVEPKAIVRENGAPAAEKMAADPAKEESTEDSEEVLQKSLAESSAVEEKRIVPKPSLATAAEKSAPVAATRRPVVAQKRTRLLNGHAAQKFKVERPKSSENLSGEEEETEVENTGVTAPKKSTVVETRRVSATARRPVVAQKRTRLLNGHAAQKFKVERPKSPENLSGEEEETEVEKAGVTESRKSTVFETRRVSAAARRPVVAQKRNGHAAQKFKEERPKSSENSSGEEEETEVEKAGVTKPRKSTVFETRRVSERPPLRRIHTLPPAIEPPRERERRL
uniref:Titin n=1 Tax=Toxocara canis TaxID=6265 RepID=A0A183U1T6_TOXCA